METSVRIHTKINKNFVNHHNHGNIYFLKAVFWLNISPTKIFIKIERAAKLLICKNTQLKFQISMITGQWVKCKIIKVQSSQ